MAYASRGLTRIMMAGKATPLSKKKQQGKAGSKTVAQGENSARNGGRGIKARAKIKEKREKDPARPTPDITVSPIRRPEPSHDSGSKPDRSIREEIPEALAYFLDVYGRRGRG
jgi:hypothetical protein